MGRGPIRHYPRHLTAARRSRNDPREHVVAELVLAAVAMVLTIAVVVSSMFGRPDRAEPEADPPATSSRPATTSPPVTTPTPAAWRAIGGARVEGAAPATAGRVAAGFTAVGVGDQGIALAELLRCAKGRNYAVTVRLRASQPEAVVQVTVLELAADRRLAADTVGAVLLDRRWQLVQVTHDAHLPGAALALEVVLPRGSPRATVELDGLEVVARRGHQVRFG